MIKKPSLGKITQGTIFCGGVAEDYSGVPVWGLIITARCDTAHEKVPNINYLPLVRAEDWANHHGAFILADRLHAELKNRFKVLLEKHSLSESLLLVHDYAAVSATHFPAIAEPVSKKDQATNKEAELAALLANKLGEAEVILSSLTTTFAQVVGLHESGRAFAQRMFQELIGGQLAGYYFIPDMPQATEHSSPMGHVALLREIHHLPRSAASQLTRGIDQEFITKENISALDCASFDLVFPVAELVPPWTEHLMQAFCTLFGRVGVADPDKTRASKIISTLLTP